MHVQMNLSLFVNSIHSPGILKPKIIHLVRMVCLHLSYLHCTLHSPDVNFLYVHGHPFDQKSHLIFQRHSLWSQRACTIHSTPIQYVVLIHNPQALSLTQLNLGFIINCGYYIALLHGDFISQSFPLCLSVLFFYIGLFHAKKIYSV